MAQVKQIARQHGFGRNASANPGIPAGVGRIRADLRDPLDEAAHPRDREHGVLGDNGAYRLHGGLALGSYLAGRFIDRITDSLRTYGLLETAIVGYALLVPLLLAGIEPLFRLVYQTLAPSFYTLSLLCFVVCGLLLLVPTTLMGATLPVLSKHVVARASHLGRSVALLYGVNTLGAVVGSFAAGFVLIPRLGVSWTIALAALLNLAVAGGVVLVARLRTHREPATGGARQPAGKKSKKKSRAPQAAPVEAGMSEGWSRLRVVVLAGIVTVQHGTETRRKQCRVRPARGATSLGATRDCHHGLLGPGFRLRVRESQLPGRDLTH